MKRILAILFTLGMISVLGGIVFTPTFVKQNVSSDGILERATIQRIEDFQVYCIIWGNLAVSGSVLTYSLLSKRGAMPSIRLYSALGFCLLVFIGSGVLYISETYPNHQLYVPPVTIKRFILGRELLLKDYQPKSNLMTVGHKVPRAKFPVINVHEHFTYPLSMGERRPEDLIRVMDAANVQKIIDLDGGLGGKLREKIRKYKTPYPERFIIFAHVWFDETGTHEHILSGKITKDLVEAAEMGASGIKMWKNLGLRSLDASGKLIPVNDPRLDPLWDKAAELGLPILIHLVDPPGNFQPLDRFNEDYEWLTDFSEWSFSGPDYPAPRVVISQFEDVLAKHRQTTFIGAHMLSLGGDDLSYLSSLLEKHPNLYVDTAFMIHRLGRQPYSARNFFLKFQDRILFGTDTWPTEEDYAAHFRFFETADEYFDPPFAYKKLPRWKIYGIFLPDEVLKKIYFQNAEQIFARRAH